MVNLEYITELRDARDSWGGKGHKAITGLKINGDVIFSSLTCENKFFDKEGNSLDVELPPKISLKYISIERGNSLDSNISYENKEVKKSELEENIVSFKTDKIVIDYNNL